MPVAATPAESLQRLGRAAAAWRTKTHADLAKLASSCRRTLLAAADDLVTASVAAKGWHTLPISAAEEWLSGPLPVARFLACVQRLHEALAAGRSPSSDLTGGTFLLGYRARIDTRPDAANTTYELPRRHGDVALVLGAGNVTATPLLDVLHQVFLEGRAVVLKPSPLHDTIAPQFLRALAPLVAVELLEIQSGDADAARALVADPGFAAVHLTGSATTWASLRESQSGTARVLTAEVGCCTPALVMPGEWRERELRRAAAQLAIHVACNGGATCVAPRLLLTARGWPQRDAFLALVRQRLASLPARVPFHPSARADHAAAALREPDGETLSPTLRTDLDPARDAGAWSREHFAPVLLELPVDADSAADWTSRVGAFVGEQVFGSLAAYVFAPASVHRAAIDAAVRALPHGTVAVNCWAGIGYGLGTTPWGVPPGRPWQHGAGWSRGTACVRDAQRVVVEAPLRPRPTPPWLRASSDGRDLARSLTRHQARPSLSTLAATAFHALRSF